MSVFEENPFYGLPAALSAWRQVCIARGYYHRSSPRHFASIIEHDDLAEIKGPTAQEKKGASK
jgi:hypothetical protein